MKTGWMLMKQSLSVLKTTPGLTRYMIMSLLWTMLLTAIVAGIFIYDHLNNQALISTGLDSSDDAQSYLLLPGWIILIVYAYIMTFITQFYGVGLSAHVLSIFRGQTTSYAQNIAIARKKVIAIATYSFITMGVGLIMQILEEKFKLLGVIAARLFGAAWEIATSFVLPVIADTNDSGLKAIKTSLHLFKKAWGETLVSRISLGTLIFLVYLLVALPISIALGFGLAQTLGIVGVIITIALFFIGIVIISLLTSMATSILMTSLYYYGTYGVVPPTFNQELLANAYRPKKQRNR